MDLQSSFCLETTQVGGRSLGTSGRSEDWEVKHGRGPKIMNQKEEETTRNGEDRRRRRERIRGVDETESETKTKEEKGRH